MAVGDYSAIFIHGWFPSDGAVPDDVEVFLHGWWSGVEPPTSAPLVLHFVAVSTKTKHYDAVSTKVKHITVSSGKNIHFIAEE